jgi:hypothetical protein
VHEALHLVPARRFEDVQRADEVDLRDTPWLARVALRARGNRGGVNHLRNPIGGKRLFHIPCVGNIALEKPELPGERRRRP